MELQKSTEPEAQEVTILTVPFLNSGDCWDEVTFEFDDGKKLYVSQNFLSMASPVFKKMFGDNSKDEKTKRVHEVFEDFLELLMCLHPNIQKPVTFENVLSLSGIAEEYQCFLIINRCKSELSRYLQYVTQRLVSNKSERDKYSSALICLKILVKAHELNYDQHVTEAVKTVVNLNFTFFTGMTNIMQPTRLVPGFSVGLTNQKKKPNFNSGSAFGISVVTSTPTTISSSIQLNPPEFTKCKEDVAKDCKELYESLPQKLKFRLLIERLQKCDIYDFD